MKLPLLVAAVMSFSMAHSLVQAAPRLEVRHSAIVNDTIPNAMLPMGIVRAGKRDLLTIFCDGGDLKPGSKAYLFRSKDLGKTWSAKPELTIAPEAENIGIGGGLAMLPGGKILLIEMVQTYLSEDRSWQAVFKGRESTFRLKISDDGGRTFAAAGELPFPKGANGGVMGTVVELVNGDLILPGYQYPGKAKGEHAYGSGFFRSRDGGKTWGSLEVAYKDPIPGREGTLQFNESTYAVRPDGSIIAYARIDSEKHEPDRIWQRKGNHLWWVESRDHGATWSTPQESNIGGIFPAMTRLENGTYLLVCGNRHAQPTRKIEFYTSPDGLDFKPTGEAPYLRTDGRCLSSATGGSQSLVVLNEREAYCVYYAADPSLKTTNNTYIEGCLIRVE